MMYFIAFIAPGDVDEVISKWKGFMKERFNCSVALRSPAHITLIPPFWMDEIHQSKLETALDEFARQERKFAVELRDFGAFRPHVIYVTVRANDELLQVRSRLEKFLTKGQIFPIKKDDRPFEPHVTIATRDLHKKSFREAWMIFKEKKYHASWQVDSIGLLKHNQKNWDVIFTSQFKSI